MHLHSWLFILSVLSAGSLCTLATPLQPHWGDMRVKHAWGAVPKNWERLGYPAVETVFDLHIALKPRRANALIDALYEVSDPSHPKYVRHYSAHGCTPCGSLLRFRYGAHLSREQAAELVAPHPKTLELINSWLEHHGVPSSNVSMSHGGWLTLTGVPVSQANALLGTSYQLYQHSETKDRIIRTIRYSLPAVLHAHVQTVVPTTYFGSPRRLHQTPLKHSGGEAVGEFVGAVSSRENEFIVKPAYLRFRYGTESYVPAATDRNLLGLLGYFGYFPSQDDLATFMNIYRSDGADATFTLGHFEPLPGGPSSTSNLEIQYAEAIAYPTPTAYYTVREIELRFPGFLWFTYMARLPKLPQTISTSYCDNEQDVPRADAEAYCRLFALFGVRGTSIISPSGDDGVGSGDCIANDGSGRVQFIPKFPASCPFVTSVGGTFSFFGGTVHPGDEVAAPHSSGGFSDYFDRPPYQNDAVSSYLRDIGDQHSGHYNNTGRGFPDVSAQAEYYEFIFMGATEYHWGTGCSTPTVAAVISLLNDYRLSRGENPLGFLNLWLYSSGHAGFKDITYGANPGCNTIGFLALPGWDPVTGFGTPRFQSLVETFDPGSPMDQD